MVERHELHCHNCNNYVQFDLNMQNGQHVLRCPYCGHKHFRIIRNGKITAERWGQDLSQNIPTFHVSSASTTYTQTSAYNSTVTVAIDVFIQGAWLNTTSTY